MTSSRLKKKKKKDRKKNKRVFPLVKHPSRSFSRARCLARVNLCTDTCAGETSKHESAVLCARSNEI